VIAAVSRKRGGPQTSASERVPENGRETSHSSAVRFLLVGILAAGLLLPTSVKSQNNAQDAEPDGGEISITFGGVVQPRLSSIYEFGREHDTRHSFGIGIQRLWLHTVIGFGDRLEAFARIDGSTVGARFIDASLEYRITGNLSLRGGRFVGAQPRGAALTPGAAIDAVERPLVAELWARGTRGADGRSYGLEGRYAFSGTDLRLLVHTGSNAMNVRGGVDGATGIAAERTRVAMSGYAVHRPAALPGLEVGAHIGFNPSRNEYTTLEGVGRRFDELSGHLYWGAEPGSQPVRLKADAIAVRYEEIAVGATAVAERLSGVSLLGALRPAPASELFGRWESVSPVGAGKHETVLTAGGSYSPSARRGLAFARERLTLSYGIRLPNGDHEPTRHVVILQGQVSF